MNKKPSKIKHFFITVARGKRDISTSREILGSGNREIKHANSDVSLQEMNKPRMLRSKREYHATAENTTANAGLAENIKALVYFVRANEQLIYLVKQNNLFSFFEFIKESQIDHGQDNKAEDDIKDGINVCHTFKLVPTAASGNEINNYSKDTDENIKQEEIIHNFRLGVNFKPKANSNVAESMPPKSVMIPTLLPIVCGKKNPITLAAITNLAISNKNSDVRSSWLSDNLILGTFKNLNIDTDFYPQENYSTENTRTQEQKTIEH